MRRRGLRIAQVLLLVAVTPFAMNQYVVQEGFVVLVAIAVVLVPVLFALVAFVLLQDGVRLALRWLNTKPSASHGLEPTACPRRSFTSQILAAALQAPQQSSLHF